VEEAKVKFSTSSILKKINLTKIIFLKKYNAIKILKTKNKGLKNTEQLKIYLFRDCLGLADNFFLTVYLFFNSIDIILLHLNY